MQKEKLYAVDLFAGCGGLSLGLEKAGFNVVWANELNPDAAKTYMENLSKRNGNSTKMVVGDICNIKIEDILHDLKGKKIDLVAAGPPCQGFSMAGQRNLNDPRNSLFKQLVRVVDTLKPSMFLMENVKGILSMDGGKVIQNVKKEFEKIGYVVQIKVLNASHFGVPQTRERVFIIGSIRDCGELHPRPNLSKIVTIKEAISDLEKVRTTENVCDYPAEPITEYQKLMRANSKQLYNGEIPQHSEKIIERFSSLKPGQTAKDLPDNLKTKKIVLFRFNDKKPSRTITTLPDDYVHYKHHRIPSVREVARIQSFPDDFVFHGPRTTGGSRRRHSVPQYSQIGNAVPPLLAQAVGTHLVKCIIAMKKKEI